MKSLSINECQAWCSEAGVPLSFDPVRRCSYPSINDGALNETRLTMPAQAGGRTALAKLVIEKMGTAPQLLFWYRKGSVNDIVICCFSASHATSKL